MIRLSAIGLLVSASATLTSQTQTGQIPASEFFEVSASKEATAEYWLEGKQALPQDEQGIVFFGQRNFQCAGGKTPFLIPAEYENGGTGTFRLEWSGSTVIVIHQSLGPASGIHKTALIACLNFEPTQVVTRIAGAK